MKTQLQEITDEIRFKLVQLSHRCKTAHLGSSLSCVDILVALYWKVLQINPDQPDDPLRDRFILSKGHAAPALYTTLSMRGYFPESFITGQFHQDGGRLAEHPGPGCAPGIEAATGSLGHGLSIGAGMALAGRGKYRVYVLLGDGECNEGSVWEAAMFAASHKLSNLCVIVDYNKWQGTGRSNEIMRLDPLAEKWLSFGWRTYSINGHNIDKLLEVLSAVKHDWVQEPVVIVADTIKGSGISFMQDDNNWHYRIPTASQVEAVRIELGL